MAQKQHKKIVVIGAGLAGCEAAKQLSRRGFRTVLYDIKPESRTAAHSSVNFGELICSNSLKSEDILTASGLLKAELRLLDSFILETADKCKVAAGTALAVDRELFSEHITAAVKNDSNIEVKCGEVISFDGDAVYIVAAGPLATHGLLETISRICGRENLAFYDAAAPIVYEESIDFASAFRGARYGKGGDDYINCPLNKEEYERFYNALISAPTVPLKDFELKNPDSLATNGDKSMSAVFEGCMPIEVLAKRGTDSIRFGPLRPTGFRSFVMGTGVVAPNLTDKQRFVNSPVPVTPSSPYAIVQLRREKAAGVIYNMVGFQTNLTYGAQKEVFSLIPALKNAAFARYGVMHRNAFVNAPAVLDGFSRLKTKPDVFIAGQLSGVEGYMESVASGLYCALNAAAMVSGKPLITLTADTMTGALINYITSASEKHFQPMNANYGILNPLDIKNKAQRYKGFYERALNEIRTTLCL